MNSCSPLRYDQLISPQSLNWAEYLGNYDTPSLRALFNVQYVALLPEHPFFRTLRLFASVLRCNNKTNLSNTFQRLSNQSTFVCCFRGRAMLRLDRTIQVFVETRKNCFFLNAIFTARRIMHFQLSGLFQLNMKYAIVHVIFEHY